MPPLPVLTTSAGGGAGANNAPTHLRVLLSFRLARGNSEELTGLVRAR
jgi:hypothetical protein